MTYQKTVWKGRAGENLDRYLKHDETDTSVILVNAPDLLTEPGTEISPENMNHIENGIEAAHNLIATEAQERQEFETALAAEAQTRQAADQNFQAALETETQERQEADTALNAALDGVQAVPLSGALLTRIINGLTPVAVNLFPQDAVFVPEKTIINDVDGVVGVYVEGVDASTILVRTMSISPLAKNEPTLLGIVHTNAGLPLTVDEAEALGWQTPRPDDYAQVRVDETQDGRRVEWYICAIDDQGNITWGNPVTINDGDYQEQTTPAMVGKLLTGGPTAGTFGAPVGIEDLASASEPKKNGSAAVGEEKTFARGDHVHPTGFKSQVNTCDIGECIFYRLSSGSVTFSGGTYVGIVATAGASNTSSGAKGVQGSGLTFSYSSPDIYGMPSNRAQTIILMRTA